MAKLSAPSTQHLKQRANPLDLSTVQALNMLSVYWGVVERGVHDLHNNSTCWAFRKFQKGSCWIMAEDLRHIHLLRTRKYLAALLVSKLIDEDKKAKKRRGKTRAWIWRRSSKGCCNNKERAHDRGHCRLFKLPMDTLGTTRAWAQHVERGWANALDFVEPHIDDRETKEMLSRVEEKVWPVCTELFV